MIRSTENLRPRVKPTAEKPPKKQQGKRTENGLGAGIGKELRKGVYCRDGYRCALCDDARRIQIHHVVSRGEGGPDNQMNLITLCPRCHLLAHGTDIDRLGLSPADVYQACVEYLSDLYAAEGVIPWNPWDPVVINFKF